MGLFDKLKYRKIGYVTDVNKQREYEMLQKVGTLHHVVYFVEKLGVYEYLYFINPDDLWQCFDFCYNKVTNSNPRIDKKVFVTNLMRILKIHKNKIMTKFITDKHDPYEIAKLIAHSEQTLPKTSKLLSVCGNLDPKMLNLALTKMCNVAHNNNIKDYELAYNKIVREKLYEPDMDISTFKFFARIIVGLSKNKTLNFDEALEKTSGHNFETFTLTLNEQAQSTLVKIATEYLSLTNQTDELSNDYAKIINSSYIREKEFANKTYDNVSIQN